MYNRFRALGPHDSLTFNYLAEHDSEFINYVLKLIPHSANLDGITMRALNKTVLDLLTKRRQGTKKNKMKCGIKNACRHFERIYLLWNKLHFCSRDR